MSLLLQARKVLGLHDRSSRHLVGVQASGRKLRKMRKRAQSIMSSSHLGIAQSRSFNGEVVAVTAIERHACTIISYYMRNRHELREMMATSSAAKGQTPSLSVGLVGSVTRQSSAPDAADTDARSKPDGMPDTATAPLIYGGTVADDPDVGAIDGNLLLGDLEAGARLPPLHLPAGQSLTAPLPPGLLSGSAPQLVEYNKVRRRQRIRPCMVCARVKPACAAQVSFPQLSLSSPVLFSPTSGPPSPISEGPSIGEQESGGEEGSSIKSDSLNGPSAKYLMYSTDGARQP